MQPVGVGLVIDMEKRLAHQERVAVAARLGRRGQRLGDLAQRDRRARRVALGVDHPVGDVE